MILKLICDIFGTHSDDTTSANIVSLRLWTGNKIMRSVNVSNSKTQTILDSTRYCHFIVDLLKVSGSLAALPLPVLPALTPYLPMPQTHDTRQSISEYYAKYI